MPLADGRLLTQALIVFAVIGLLGLVLRWTFSHDVRHSAQPDQATDTTLTGPTPADPMPGNPVPGNPVAGNPVAGNPVASNPVASNPVAGHPLSGNPVSAEEEDFGLLATVAMFDTREDANRVRALLADAGIRATTSVSADNRHRVLVFSSELDRARRVGGGSA